MAWNVAETSSPFYLRLAGTWVHLEGVNIGVPIATDRPSSTFTSLGGHRYHQRAPLARRTWSVSLSSATPAGIAALSAATELDEVWLMDETVANMLPPRSCFGDSTAVDCDTLSLPGFSSGDEVTGRVRGGKATTLALWTSGALSPAASITYPGGTGSVTASSSGQSSETFTPSSDGEVTITMPSAGVAGLTLTEGDPPDLWTPGESMPCKVMVEDPAETLLGKRDGAYRSDYAIRIVEVD